MDVILELLVVTLIIVDIVPIIYCGYYNFISILYIFRNYSEHFIKIQSRTGYYSFILGSDFYFFCFFPALFKELLHG